MEKHGFHYRLGLNGDNVAQQWSVTGTPTLFFINRKGEIIARNQISNPESTIIKKLISKILQD
jgi:hypothetical protein